MSKLDDIITVPLLPQSEYIQGQEQYYMLPKTNKASGILIFLHSCKRSGLEFFHLPEDRIIAYDALKKGLAVLAPTSKDRDSGCYTQDDYTKIDSVVDEWAGRLKLEDLPRIGMSYSSGSSFMFFTHHDLKLKSMAVYNTPQFFPRDDLEEKLVIPTVFVTMYQDETIAHQMRASYHRLLKSNIPAQLYEVQPHPFTPTLCMARFPELIPKDCEDIFKIIHSDFPQLLDVDGFVKEPMTSGQWEPLFSKLESDFRIDKMYFKTKRATSRHSWLSASFEQEIRTCHGFHAMTSEHHSNVLDFLIQQAGIIPNNDEEAEGSS